MRYKVGNNEYDPDSITNLSIKSKYVEQHVCACVTSMVEYIIGKQYCDEDRDAPFEIDDIENYFASVCPVCDSDCGFSEMDVCKCDCCGTMHETEEKAASCSGCF